MPPRVRISLSAERADGSSGGRMRPARAFLGSLLILAAVVFVFAITDGRSDTSRAHQLANLVGLSPLEAKVRAILPEANPTRTSSAHPERPRCAAPRAAVRTR